MRRRFSAALLLIASAHMVIEFSNNFLPILYPILMPAMGLNFAQVGFIALVAATSLSLSQPLFGYVSDRWGSMYMAAASIIWIGVAMSLVGFARTYISLLMLIALGSLGSAAFHPAGAVIAAANSGSKRGSGLSVFSVGGNLGTALSPLWMVLAIGWLGLAGTLTILPLSVLFGVIFYLQMRRRMAKLSEAQAARTGSTARGFLAGMILIIAAMMFRSWYQVAFMTYLPTWIETTGGTLNAGSRMLAVFLFSISIGSLVGGPAGDRFGYLPVLIVALVSLPLMHWTFLNSAGTTQLFAIFLSGVAVGSTYPTSIVMVLEAWPRQAGIATGLLMGLGWWPGGLGAALTGFLADEYTLTAALATLTFVPLLGVVCLLIYGLVSRARFSPATSSQP